MLLIAKTKIQISLLLNRFFIHSQVFILSNLTYKYEMVFNASTPFHVDAKRAEPMGLLNYTFSIR